MYVVSKILSTLLNPLVWVALLLCCGVLLLYVSPRIGRRFCVGALVLLLAIGWVPLPEAMLRHLESQHAAPTGDLSGFAGMVVLGGAFASNGGRHVTPIALGCAGERVVEPIPFMNKYPHMRLLFTGGSSSILRADAPEADAAQLYFERMGMDASRLQFERQSRNTHENATYGARTVGAEAVGKPWLLVTSAWHMPRAYATFVKAGWNVTPYPVDFVTDIEVDWMRYSLASGLEVWQLAIREYVGYAAYWTAGRL